MCWWIPLVAAAVNLIQSDNKKKQAEKDMTADTINSIKQSHARDAGGYPYQGMAVNNAINVGRADRDYQPPVNAVGAAIQAMGSGGSGADAASSVASATAPLIQPSGYGSPGDDPFRHNSATYRDPWDVGEDNY